MSCSCVQPLSRQASELCWLHATGTAAALLLLAKAAKVQGLALQRAAAVAAANRRAAALMQASHLVVHPVLGKAALVPHPARVQGQHTHLSVAPLPAAAAAAAAVEHCSRMWGAAALVLQVLQAAANTAARGSSSSSRLYSCRCRCLMQA
ncbi:hypothetical protein COO60DRAFT_1535392 [Scenedesmus sp. NREL 46B-D3]|nr:hypothetical protein COO60DRAFT_1535392 [Scenedesmus sp. NREL 46B-D3]